MHEMVVGMALGAITGVSLVLLAYVARIHKVLTEIRDKK